MKKKKKATQKNPLRSGKKEAGESSPTGTRKSENQHEYVIYSSQCIPDAIALKNTIPYDLIRCHWYGLCHYLRKILQALPSTSHLLVCRAGQSAAARAPCTELLEMGSF